MTPQILNEVPWDAPMPSGPQNLLIALSLIVLALALWFVRSETKRRGDWVPIYAFIGAGLAVIYEPLGDMLVCALYPMNGQIGWISLFGRSIPLFIGVLYFWYMSVPGLYFLRQVDSGLTRARFWRDYWMMVVIAIGIEVYGVSQQAWVYYGEHAYVLFGVPLWAPFTYAGFSLAICIALHAMTTRLDRRHHWLVIFGLPLSVFSTTEPLWLWIGATITIALSIGLAWAMSMVYCVDGKLAQSRKTAHALNVGAA